MFKLDFGVPPHYRDAIRFDATMAHLTLDAVGPWPDNLYGLVYERVAELVRDAEAKDSEARQREQRLVRQGNDLISRARTASARIEQFRAQRRVLELEVPDNLAEKLVEIERGEQEQQQALNKALAEVESIQPLLDETKADHARRRQEFVRQACAAVLNDLRSKRAELVEKINAIMSPALDQFFMIERAIGTLQSPAGGVNVVAQAIGPLLAAPAPAPTLRAVPKPAAVPEMPVTAGIA